MYYRSPVLSWFAAVVIVASTRSIASSDAPAEENASRAEETRRSRVPVFDEAPSGLGVIYEQVVERGPHHRRIERAERVKAEDGSIIVVTNHVDELRSGLHYREGNRWVESRDLIELDARGGASARQGPIKVHFAPNAKSLVVVDLDRVGGGVTPAVPPHHRTYGSVSRRLE